MSCSEHDCNICGWTEEAGEDAILEALLHSTDSLALANSLINTFAARPWKMPRCEHVDVEREDMRCTLHVGHHGGHRHGVKRDLGGSVGS